MWTRACKQGEQRNTCTDRVGKGIQSFTKGGQRNTDMCKEWAKEYRHVPVVGKGIQIQRWPTCSTYYVSITQFI